MTTLSPSPEYAIADNDESYTVLQNLAADRWREFVAAHPCSTIFHTPEMTSVYGSAPGHRGDIWAAEDSDGAILALFNPVRVSLYGGPLSAFTTRSVAYGGALCLPNARGELALSKLLHAYNRTVRGTAFTELRNQSDASALQPVLHANGYHYQGHLNYLIDLRQPEERILGKVSASTRKRVRAAQRNGLAIEEAGDLDTVREGYRLLQDVYARVHVPLPADALFEAAFNILSPLGMIKIFVARFDGHVIGVDFLLIHKGRVIDWYGGADHAYSRLSPNESLILHHIRWARDHGYSVFDLGGAGKPDEPYGVRDFKAKFGGTLVNLGRNTCVHAPQRLRISQAGYRLVRRFLL